MSITTQQINTSNTMAVPSYASIEIQVTSGMLGLCCVLGVPGNLVVLAVLQRRLAGGNFTLWLMLNLALSDLLTLLTLPVWIYTLLHGWNLGTTPCKLLSCLVYWSLYTSVLCVCLLSVQCYIQVLYPRHWDKFKSTGRRILLGVVWALGGVVSSHALVQREVELGVDGLLRCLPQYRWHGEQMATLLMESLLLFVLPFSIMTSLYITLHRRVKQTIRSGHKRMKKLVVSIIVAFFIFSVPVHVNNMLTIVAVCWGSYDLLQFSKVASDVAGAMTFMNSCVVHRALSQSTAKPPNPSLNLNKTVSVDVIESSNL